MIKGIKGDSLNCAVYFWISVEQQELVGRWRSTAMLGKDLAMQIAHIIRICRHAANY